MVLVTGSTGMVGSEVCRLLAEQGRPFRALVRATADPVKVERLKTLGAVLAIGDLRDRDSLLAACDGVEAVICTISAMPFSYQPGVNDIQAVDHDGVASLIAAAHTSGVKHFIHTTFSGNIDRDFPLRNAKRAVEQLLKGSGMDYTILRPSYFMEIWLSPAVGFYAANAKATIYGAGDKPLAWISFKDVARFAVESLQNPAARNRTLELGGPESLSPHRIIELFEEAMGTKFEVAHVPPDTLQAQYEGASDPMQKSFIALMQCYAQGDRIDMSGIQRTFNVRLTTIHDYIRCELTKSCGASS